MSAILTIACCFAGCNLFNDPEGNEGNEGNEGVEIGTLGFYVLDGKTVQGNEIGGEYLFNCISLQEGGEAVWYETDFSGRTEKTGTFTVSENTVTVTIGVRPYEFVYNDETGTMTFTGKINRQNVVMRYVYDEDYSLPATTTSGVAFTDELFGEDLNENFYNYCPTIIMEGNDTMHVWYCSNKDSGNVTDYIAYRKGTLNGAGKWEFSERQLVLEHGEEGEWDGRHVCDPTVIQGAFQKGNQTYSYLMAFLGCKTGNNQYNEVGLAVAKSPEGPWEKLEDMNPVANFYESDLFVEGTWGFGQPSLLSVNEKGKVLLFYAGGALQTHTYVEEWDLSNLNNPQKLRSAQINERGVVNTSGGTDCINNADFAYDPVLGRLYCLKEDFPYPTDGGVNWITGSNTLMYLEVGNNFDLLFGNEVYTWSVCGQLTSGTGHARNHNAGIVTNSFGCLTNPYRVPVLYTAAKLLTEFPDWELGGQWPSLHTYRIHGISFDVM